MTYILRIIFLFLLILIHNIKISTAGDITCSDWTKPRDAQGIREVCHDFLPFYWERFKIARMNIDPFDTIYKIYHQICANPLRYPFDGSFDCKFCLIPGWDDTCFSLWFPALSATFTVDDIGNRDTSTGDKTVFIHHVCMKRFPPGERFLHGDDNINTTNRTKICGYYVQPFNIALFIINPYIALIDYLLSDGMCMSPMLSWDHAFIGCVDAPIKPGPQTYNKIIPAGMSPVVDTSTQLDDTVRSDGVRIPGYLSLGSRFDQPVVRLNEIAGLGTVENSLLLRYRYPGDTTVHDKVPNADLKRCGVIPNSKNAVTYCAAIPTDSPAQVCVCEQAKCEDEVFLGCVPRPTPKQSNYRIMAEYTQLKVDEQNNGVTIKKAYPALNMYFTKLTQSGKVIYLDADGTPAAEGEDGIKFKLDDNNNLTATPAKEPIVPAKLSLPNTLQQIREYYLLTNSTYNLRALSKGYSDPIYGVKFTTIIPKFEADGKYRKVLVNTPTIRRELDGCVAFSIITDTNPALKSIFPTYYVPAGKRLRDVCCPNEVADKTMCLVPPITACRDGRLLEADCLAEFAACPGAYNGPEDKTKPDKICLITDGVWDIISENDQVCAEIPADLYPASSEGSTCAK